MRVDRDGRLLQQATVWLPVEVMNLLRADGLNLTAFVRQQIELMYGSDPNPADRRLQLVKAARDTLARQREANAEREANRERARDAVRQMRADRDAAQARQKGIAEALHQVAGKRGPAGLARLLPENDPEGDRLDDWDGLVRRVGRLCGAEIDSAEVAAGLRALIAIT